jgi:hypothetical protein
MYFICAICLIAGLFCPNLATTAAFRKTLWDDFVITLSRKAQFVGGFGLVVALSPR